MSQQPSTEQRVVRDDAGPFRFEFSYDTREMRPELKATERSGLGITEDRMFVIFAVLGALCLIWRYTVALGAVTLALTTFLWRMRQRSREWYKRKELVEETPQVIRMTLTESGYSLRGEDFFAETNWSNVISSFELNGFLLIQGRRMPRLYVPIDELKRAGLYERVHAMVDERTQARKAAIAAIKARSEAL
jgi:hypothetical protein